MNEEVQSSLRQLDQAVHEGADWDDQEGIRVSVLVASQAKAFLRELALASSASNRAWEPPAVSATPNGDIHFSWNVNGSRGSFTVDAATLAFTCCTKAQGKASCREVLSREKAVRNALEVWDSGAEEE